MKSIFISKQHVEVPKLAAACRLKGINLITESFISFERIPTSVPQHHDVVFFSSPRSVSFFFELSQDNLFVKDYACMGRGTESALLEKGKVASFVGTLSSDPSQVFRDFKSWLGNRKATVPHAVDSLFSIKQYIDALQLTFIPVYKTIPIHKVVPPAEVYIFSSPSNAAAFLEKNQVKEFAQVFAWGKSTQKYLTSRGFSVSKTLTLADESELIDILNLC